VSNSTLSGNSADFGGGIDNRGTLTVSNSTLSGNSADFGGGIDNLGTLTLESTIVAGDTARGGPDISGALTTDSAFNLIGDGSGLSGISDNDANGNLVGHPALLAPLGNYGGPTQTMALLPGSLAIGNGGPAGHSTPATDQRGFPRPTAGPIDIGAFQTQASPFVVTTAADPGGLSGALSLREAVNLANAYAAAGSSASITFDTAQMGISTVPLHVGQLTLDVSGSTVPVGTETIDGGGTVRVNGNDASRVFQVNDGVQAAFSGLTIQDGNAAFSFGGGILNYGALTLGNSTLDGNTAYNGGGIFNQGTLAVSNVTLSGNSASFGGGINNVARLTLQSVTVSGNSASFGGGLYNLNGFPTPSPLTLESTIVAGNTAPDSPDISGTLAATSAYNLVGDGSGLSGISDNDANHNLVGHPALLAPLGNYGGPTQTMALLPGSPALDAGSNALAVDPSTGLPLATDQRGLARVVNGAVDIGAFESRGFTIAVAAGDNQQLAVGAAPVPLTVLVTANSPGEPVAGGRVTFTAPATGASATLNGSPATIAANGDAGVTAAAGNTLGSYTVTAGSAGAPGGPAVFHLTNTITAASLQQALASAQGNPVTVQADTTADVNALLAAASSLDPGTSGTLSLVLSGFAKYGSMTVSAPANVTVSINGMPSAQVPTPVDPAVPALVVTSGKVVVSYVNFTESGDAPTIRVTGGSLTLRHDVVQESTGFTDPAIAVTGGTLDLGTAADPGGNTLNVNGAGEFVHNTTANTVPAVGDTFAVNGTPLAGPALSFTTLTTGAATTLLGQKVTFTATVRPDGTGTPSGSVDFFDATTNTELGRVPLSGGRATLTTAALGVGAHLIRASYSGDGSFLPSLDALTQAVHYAFSGFLPPLRQNAVFGLGTTVPINFQLSDYSGKLISRLGAVTSLQVERVDAAGNPLAPPLTPANTGNAGLTYDGNHYSFNWQTAGLSAGYYDILLSPAVCQLKL
jgi:hypothetical protein